MFRKLFKSTSRTEVLYKEYCPDIRNSRVIDIIEEFLTGKGQAYVVEKANDGIEAMEKLEEIRRLEAAL